MDLTHDSCHITDCRKKADIYTVWAFCEDLNDWDAERDLKLTMVVGFCDEHYRHGDWEMKALFYRCVDKEQL